METPDERLTKAREIYDHHIMVEMLAHAHVRLSHFNSSTNRKLFQNYSKESLQHVQYHLLKQNVPPDLFHRYVLEICDQLRGDIFQRFLESDKFTRFCQWKNLELNMQLTMNDFSVHRIIGRGGFGEVYGCRKADTGKM